MKKKSVLKGPRILLADDIPAGGQDQRSRSLREIAGRLASRLKASIDLVHVEDDSFYPVSSPHYALMFEHYARERDSRLKMTEIDGGVPVRSILLSGSPALKLLSTANKRDAYEMVVVGTQGRKGLNRLFTGSVAEEVIRRSRIPVLSAGPLAQEKCSSFLSAPKQGEKLKILVPCSLSKNSARAEELALKLAKKLGGEVILFYSLYDGMHPVIQSVFAMPTPAAEMAGMIEDLKANAQEALVKKSNAFRKKGVPASVIIDGSYSNADDAVIREAKNTKAALIVMGTHGRSLLSGAFFGRTARGVILGSEVPVITVQSRSA